MPKLHSTERFLERLNRFWPEMASVESDTVIALLRFNDLIRERTDEALAPFDLTPAAFEVLVSLRSTPEPRQLTPTDLYRSLLMSSGGLTKVLINLENRGLISRAPNQEDRRSKLVCLTASGKRLAERSMKEVTKLDKALFDEAASMREVEKLRGALLRLLIRIEAD